MSDCEQVVIEQDSETIEETIEEPVEEQPKRKRRTKKDGRSPKHSTECDATTDTGERKPKRKCSEKQLAALAAGRAKNNHFKPKSG